jgi:hypothetical protein
LLAANAQVTINDNARFIDDKGREIMFHGVNSVYKIAPYIPETTFNPDSSISDSDI